MPNLIDSPPWTDPTGTARNVGQHVHTACSNTPYLAVGTAVIALLTVIDKALDSHEAACSVNRDKVDVYDESLKRTAAAVYMATADQAGPHATWVKTDIDHRYALAFQRAVDAAISVALREEGGFRKVADAGVALDNAKFAWQRSHAARQAA